MLEVESWGHSKDLVEYVENYSVLILQSYNAQTYINQ